MADREFESRVLRFEQDWRLRGPRAIEDYLGGPFAVGSPERHLLLVELICVDLEYRWRNPAIGGGPAVLRDYAERFPELVSLDRLPIELIGEEYRVRSRWGDRPAHEEFLAPFRGRREEVRAELLRVDAEIEEESAESATPARSLSRGTPPGGPTDPGLDGPLLSYRDFLLRRLIGAGRTGKVYEARQHSTGCDVAVKFLRKSYLGHPGVVRRFVGEARMVAGLHHPNIVGTRGLGRTAAGAYFIVMDLASGGNLAQVIGGRAVSEEEAIRWSLEICDALGHAHERGIIHCDLKPANILLDESGRIRVADFGLARPIAEEAPWAAEVEGTAPFMAPEQACRSWGSIDQRTDVYGIGAVLYALLTGRPPFVGSRLPDVLADVIAPTPIVPPSHFRPGLSGVLDGLCRKCLSKAREDRYQSAREVGSALAALRMASAGSSE